MHRPRHILRRFYFVKAAARLFTATSVFGQACSKICLGYWTHKILLSSLSRCPLTVYVDSDWVGFHQTGRSTTEILISLNNAPIFWQSKRWALVSLGSTKAGYTATSHCRTLIIWPRLSFWELSSYRTITDEPQLPPTTIKTDSMRAIALTKIQSVSERNKNIDLKYNHIRDLHKQKTIKFEHIRTFHQPSDILTIPVSATILRRFAYFISMWLNTTCLPSIWYCSVKFYFFSIGMFSECFIVLWS